MTDPIPFPIATDADVMAYLNRRIQSCGIEGIVLTICTAPGSFPFLASIGGMAVTTSTVGYGYTLDEAIDRLRAEIPSKQDRARKLYEQGNALIKESERLLALG